MSTTPIPATTAVAAATMTTIPKPTVMAIMMRPRIPPTAGIATASAIRTTRPPRPIGFPKGDAHQRDEQTDPEQAQQNPDT
jgi:hypothetical protein